MLIKKKRTCDQADLAVPVHSRGKIKYEGRQIFESCNRAEKSLKYEGDNDTNGSWCPWNDSQGPRKKSGRISCQR